MESMEDNMQGRISEIREDKLKLDLHDKKILFHLSQDSRMPLSELSKKIKLARDTIDYRIKRLVKNNVIQRFVPIIDVTKLGYFTFHVFMVINEINLERKNALIKTLKEHSHTKSLMEYTARWDLEWTLVAVNLQEFDRIVSRITTEYPDVIVEKVKLEIIDGYKSIHLPAKFYHENGEEIIRKHKKEKIKTDKTDLDILSLLSHNARMSSYEIGEKLKLSSNAVRYRIRKMHDCGLIMQFTIIVNLTALGYHWYVMSIILRTMDDKYDSKFRQFVQDNLYILRAVKVLGPWDLMLYIAADTMKHFHVTVKKVQEEFVNIMVNYETLIAYIEHTYISLPRIIREKFEEKRSNRSS